VSDIQMTGTQYRRLIARYVLAAHGDRGVQVYEEVPIGTSIIGKQRRVDLLVLQERTQSAYAIECKYQDSPGTVDEKIPYALRDLTAMPLPGIITYAGSGFSTGVLHLLQGSEHAAYCLPDESMKALPRRAGASIDSGTWQLDHALALAFGWWDLIVAGKQPLLL
jgi:hypothetical protein